MKHLRGALIAMLVLIAIGVLLGYLAPADTPVGPGHGYKQDGATAARVR